ncbi:hypothetical protein FE257_009460 [Aspergillus nanangensis]|uniref:Xylanolytic transcriptional activator regulatory domain-containing protein n=1 Tax=Aspergillus nanangensis TaxID=2582783 RepID=A0AAD4GTZ3_ASPNN|nr:hypothetical protein FE257_009460 [Aspergillus nanangensis]
MILRGNLEVKKPVAGLECEYPQDARRTAVRTKKADVRSLQRQIEELKGRIQDASAIDSSLVSDSVCLEEYPDGSSIVLEANTPQPRRVSSQTQARSNDAQRERLQHTGFFTPSATEPGSLSLSQGPAASTEDRALSPDANFEGEIHVYGATSLLHDHSSEPLSAMVQSKQTEDIFLKQAAQDRLIANAAVRRQKELLLYSNPSITANIDFDGLPMDTAMHLLDLHWNRQHLLYMTTYRPAIMDSLVSNGPYVNKLLLNAIYLQCSLYSDRISLRVDPADPQTTGMAFYERFKALLIHYIDKPTVPTVVALLICGACLVPHGKQSAGWMLCGMAYRMITDLGYHLDVAINSPPNEKNNLSLSATDMEIRRRVYWGAYVSDKFQSLFLGRPPAMHESDGNIPHEFLDSYEELEEWKPYIDLDDQSQRNVPVYRGRPSYAISTFQNLRQLCAIAARIINAFYTVNSAKTPAAVLLHTRDEIRAQLAGWRAGLPAHLQFEPGAHATPPPHQITPHTTFWTLIILTEQAFLKRGHFHFPLDPASEEEEARQRCIDAALKIWKIVEAYKKAFTLRRAQYGISYATYCAVLVMLQQSHQDEEHLDCIRFFWHALLDYQKGCYNGLKRPLRLLKSLMRRVKVTERINVDNVDGADLPMVERPAFLRSLDAVDGSSSGIGMSGLERFCTQEHDSSTFESFENRKTLAWNHLIKTELFRTQSRANVPQFSKPMNYVAMVLAERCPSEADMQDRVRRAVVWKELTARHALPSAQAHKVVNHHDIRSKL